METCSNYKERIRCGRGMGKGKKNLEIGVSTKLIVTARIRGNVLRKRQFWRKKILKKKNFEKKNKIKILKKKNFQKKKIFKKNFPRKKFKKNFQKKKFSKKFSKIADGNLWQFFWKIFFALPNFLFSQFFCPILFRTNLRNSQSKSTASYDVM